MPIRMGQYQAVSWPVSWWSIPALAHAMNFIHIELGG